MKESNVSQVRVVMVSSGFGLRPGKGVVTLCAWEHTGYC
jgi:hypothetical protein